MYVLTMHQAGKGAPFRSVACFKVDVLQFVLISAEHKTLWDNSKIKSIAVVWLLVNKQILIGWFNCSFLIVPHQAPTISKPPVYHHQLLQHQTELPCAGFTQWSSHPSKCHKTCSLEISISIGATSKYWTVKQPQIIFSFGQPRSFGNLQGKSAPHMQP